MKKTLIILFASIMLLGGCSNKNTEHDNLVHDTTEEQLIETEYIDETQVEVTENHENIEIIEVGLTEESIKLEQNQLNRIIIDSLDNAGLDEKTKNQKLNDVNEVLNGDEPIHIKRDITC